MTTTPGIGWNHSWQRTLLFVLLLALSFSSSSTEQDERRILIGLRLFPAVLAAVQDIGAKSDAEGRLPILLVYRTDRDAAEQLASRFLGLKGDVRGMPLHVVPVALDDLPAYLHRPVAGLFLTERMPDQLAQIRAYAYQGKLIAFSPFQHDVEQGITSGLFVSDRILPYINLRSAQLSGIRFKPFFLEVAKHYDD